MKWRQHIYQGLTLFAPRRSMASIGVGEAWERYNRPPKTICPDCQYEDRNGHAPDCQHKDD